MRRLSLLGPARVDQVRNTHSQTQENGGGAVPRFRSRRTVALLGYLTTEQRPVARDFLAGLFWPDETPSKGRANLSREMHNLAQILPDCWEMDRQSVAFIPSADTIVDLYQLQGLEAEERWGEAVQLLGGEFLEGVYLDDNPEFENWLLGERERWRGRAESVIERVIEGHWRRGRYADALHYAQRLLQLAPWNEATHVQVMRLLAWTGQRGAALRHFEFCKKMLAMELGVEPSEETTALYQQIQAGILDLPPQLPAFLTDEKARRAFERPPFVRRTGELERLDTFLKSALAGQGRPIFITGGPGRGKTALLETFAQRAMEKYPSLLVAGGKCNAYSGVGDPYLPYRDVMAMLTGDVEGRWDAGAITRDHAQRLWAAFSRIVRILLDHGPHLLDVFVPGGALLSRAMAAEGVAPWLPRLREHIKGNWTRTQEGEQSHLFQQVTNVLRTIAQEHPLLLILDDIQWADAASISLLFHLGRRLGEADSKLLIACAYRPEEVALGRNGDRHPLTMVLSEFKRTFGDVWVHLGHAERGEGRRFVDALLDSERNVLGSNFRAALFDRTGGHALFTVELLRAMKERGDLRLEPETDGAWTEGPTLDWEVLPARVEAVIEARIDRLDPELREILTIACVEGEVFTAQVVAEVQDVPKRSILRRLSQDLEQRHRLVREQVEVYTGQRRLYRYRFGHGLFQNYLYKQLSQGERRLLHGDVGVALETLYEGQLDELAVQLAQHFYLADDPIHAFHYLTLAAERAAHIYASGEAITHYTRAIQLAGRVPPDSVSLARLHRGRGQAYGTLGDFECARTDHEIALKLARVAGEHRVEWRALLGLGRLWAARDHDRSREYFEAGLDLARHIADPIFLAGSLNWMGNWSANAANPVKAAEYHHEALNIFEAVGDRGELAMTLDLLGIANWLAGDLIASVQYYDRAVALSRELDDRPRLASSLVGRATTCSGLVFQASVSAPVSCDPMIDIQEALRIAREIDSASDEVWVHWSRGLLQLMHGHFQPALMDFERGLRISSDIGHREWVVGNRFALGVLYAEVYAPDQAKEHLEGALSLTRDLRSPTWIHLVSGALARAYLIMGDLTSTQACLETVISPQTPMDTLGKRYCWVRRAELALAQDDPALAMDITERLIASAPGMSPGRVITYLWSLKGDALAALGQSEAACSWLRAALDNARDLEERFLLWRVHASLGQRYLAMNDSIEARKAFSAARTLIDELGAAVSDEVLKDKFLQGAYNSLDLHLGGDR